MLPRCRILEWRKRLVSGRIIGGRKNFERSGIDRTPACSQTKIDSPAPRLVCQAPILSAGSLSWKGRPTEVVQEGVQQIELNRTNACIVNGSAFGPGFGFCTEQGLVRTLPTKDALADWLAGGRWHAHSNRAANTEICCIRYFDELFSNFS